jgi:LmbE family N-acetylglucosaminyl deacetylase
MVVIAPHPDDEILGPGGLIADQKRRGLPVLVIAVTDGEAAYPEADGLAHIRQMEQEQALRKLGVASRDIIRLHLPDSEVSDYESQLTRLLTPFIAKDSLIVAPWSFDFHPDHEACGRVANRVAQVVGAALVSYLFWTWHRSGIALLTAEPLHRFDLDAPLEAAKADALAQHRSQLSREAGPALLPDSLLGPARRSFETFIIEDC